MVGASMKWEEARELFPNRFLLVAILKCHEEDNCKIVKEVKPIRTIADEDANRAFLHAEEGTVVYHTSNKEFIIHLRNEPERKMHPKFIID